MKVLLIDGPSEGRIIEVSPSTGYPVVTVLDPSEILVSPIAVSSEELARTNYYMDNLQLFGMNISVGYSCSQSERDRALMNYFIRPEAIGRIAEL